MDSSTDHDSAVKESVIDLEVTGSGLVGCHFSILSSFFTMCSFRRPYPIAIILCTSFLLLAPLIVHLILYNNPLLIDLTGLENVTSVGTVTLFSMPHSDFSWLNRISSATRLQILHSQVSDL